MSSKYFSDAPMIGGTPSIGYDAFAQVIELVVTKHLIAQVKAAGDQPLTQINMTDAVEEICAEHENAVELALPEIVTLGIKALAERYAEHFLNRLREGDGVVTVQR